MDKTMIDPIEQRIKTLELKVEFLENWKNTPFIQVTLPVILSIFLATSWNSFGLTSMDKSIGSLDKRIDKIEIRMDKLDVRMNRLETKMDTVLSELTIIKSGLKKS